MKINISFVFIHNYAMEAEDSSIFAQSGHKFIVTLEYIS